MMLGMVFVDQYCNDDYCFFDYQLLEVGDFYQGYVVIEGGDNQCFYQCIGDGVDIVDEVGVVENDCGDGVQFVVDVEVVVGVVQL